MNEVLTVIENRLSAEERNLIVKELVSYNDAKAPSESYRELTIVLRQNGKLIGGLYQPTLSKPE